VQPSVSWQMLSSICCMVAAPARETDPQRSRWLTSDASLPVRVAAWESSREGLVPFVQQPLGLSPKDQIDSARGQRGSKRHNDGAVADLRSLHLYRAFDADVLAMPSTSAADAFEIDKVRARGVGALNEARRQAVMAL
jgi:hypothetical protein